MAGVLDSSRRRPDLPQGCPCSTIGPGGLIAASRGFPCNRRQRSRFNPAQAQFLRSVVDINSDDVPFGVQIQHKQSADRKPACDLRARFAAGWKRALQTRTPAKMAGVVDSSRRRPTLPRGRPRSTIGPGGLNFRVRDGNGCFPSGMIAGKLFCSQSEIRDWGNTACRACASE